MSEPSVAPARSELSLRLMSAAIMGSIAILTTWWGGWPFGIVWTVAAGAVAAEWQTIIGADNRDQRAIGAVLAVVFTSVCVAFGVPLYLFPAACAVAAVLWLCAADMRSQSATGMLYACSLVAAVLLCRGAGWEGAIVIFWLFAAVWGTDTCAYFAGRAIGGPKLWPRVSPKKTWSGAIGGVIGALAISALVLVAFGIRPGAPHIAMSIVFSVATQAGDLFESALKRRFGVKDAGRLIPGHGGFMDRLDGFVFAVVVAAIIGLARGGWQNVPAGLLHW
jgi:phosphatidate cytidylyltransferase